MNPDSFGNQYYMYFDDVSQYNEVYFRKKIFSKKIFSQKKLRKKIFDKTIWKNNGDTWQFKNPRNKKRFQFHDQTLPKYFTIFSLSRYHCRCWRKLKKLTFIFKKHIHKFKIYGFIKNSVVFLNGPSSLHWKTAKIIKLIWLIWSQEFFLNVVPGVPPENHKTPATDLVPGVFFNK